MSIIAYTKSGKRAYRAQIKYQCARYTKAGFPTKEAAKAWMVAKRRELKNAPAPEPQALSEALFSQASDSYLADCGPRMQPGTVREKRTHLAAFAVHLGGDCLLNSIPTKEARTYIAAVQAQAGNKAANRHLRTLKACWNWSSKQGLVLGNVWAQVEPYPEDAPARYVPPSEDVAAVLMACQPWERDFLAVLLRTGARAGELRKLTWEDVDLSRGVLTLWTRKRKGGARQPRPLTMSPQLHTLMRRLWDARDKSSPYVWTNPHTGEPYTKLHHAMRYMMERLCARADVKHFGLHSLRHYVAVRLRDSGKASKFDIQAVLGHQRSDTTDIYLRGLAPDLKEAVGALDDDQGETCAPDLCPLSSR